MKFILTYSIINKTKREGLKNPSFYVILYKKKETMMNLLLNCNWNFGTTELITLLGTIATFLAVVVALWQTTSSRKKKLKLELNFVTTLAPFTQDLEEYINLTVANIGNCSLKLSNWYMFIGDTKLCILNTPIKGTTNTSFPLFLNPSEDGSFFLEKEKFINTVMLGFKDELLKTNKLKTGCFLSTGELITIEVKITNLFRKQTVNEVYEYIDKLNTKQ